MKQIIPFLVMSVCVAMYFVYIKPELVVIDEKKAEYAKYKMVIDEIKEIKTLRDDLTSKYDSIPAEDLTKLDKIIPETFDPVLFANDINSLIAKHSLKVTSLNIEYQRSNTEGITDETQVGENTHKNIVVSFSVSGDYDKLFAFLKELETSLRLLDVTSLAIKSGIVANSTDKNPKTVYSYDIKLKTYSLK